MSDPVSAAESPRAALETRLAGVLGVERADLPDLTEVPDEDLRTLHDQVRRSVFAESEHRFARIAGLASVLPGPVAARIAEKFLPPVIAARVAELLEPARARDLVRRLPVRYLASVAAALDPARSQTVVQSLSAERIREVSRELLDRGDHDVLGRLATAVSADQLDVVVDEVRATEREALRPHLPPAVAARLDGGLDGGLAGGQSTP